MAGSWLLLLCGMMLSTSAAHAARARSEFLSGLELPSAEYLDSRADSAPRGAAGGTKWALLIAGSNGYGNYRHQADVCHAYQLLKKDGLKDENIVVFMYDDIAENEENPRRGTIINHPQGSDVYAGVPKDYTGEDVTVSNFLAALVGNKSAISGGSGKVIASGPEDHVFVFYTDHGGPGILGMPTYPFLLADDIIDALETKHAAGGYKELVFYLEACESGSIFQGLLPKDINVYAVTAANAEENSWGTYCPGMHPPPPPEYDTCLGDLFSVAWMEDSDVHNLEKETLLQQYRLVKARTAGDGSYFEGSHVMQYGNKSVDLEEVAAFLGSDPANVDAPPVEERPSSWVQGWLSVLRAVPGERAARSRPRGVGQREAEMLHLEHKYKRATDAGKKAQALAEFLAESGARSALRLKMDAFATALAGSVSPALLLINRGPEAPLVDDWGCLRATIRAYEGVCGPLTQYGMQYTRVFADVCNALGNSDAAASISRKTAQVACGEQPPYNGPFSV